MRSALTVAAIAFAFASAGSAAEPSSCPNHKGAVATASSDRPYAGETSRVVKSLSDADTTALQSGAGMGLAKAAELNHYPGPKHVLDLADELRLSPAQREAAQRAFDEMKTNAMRLGSEIVAKETDLDRLFASGNATAGSVASATAAIAALQGELRAVHLSAHLRMREIMTPEQIAAYDTLRGYGK